LKERLAYDTLYTVLTTAIRSFAPFLPLISEDLYRALTGALSVHLTDWPDVSQFPEDPQLVDETDLVRDVCSAANSIREERRLRTRLPLPALIVGGPSAASLRSYRDVICDEVNVKDLILAPSAVEYAKPELHVLTPIAGKRLRSHLKEVLKSVEAGTWVLTPDGGVEVGSVSLLPGEFEIRQRVREGLTGITLPERKLVVLLDLTTTPQLEKEGRARDLVRAVQSARKDAGLHVSDRIALDCWTEDLELADAIEEYRTYIAGETLAIQMSVSRGDSGSAMTKVNIGGSLVSLSLRKISGND
jgi:isoleucyl-tRNA synthetase